MIRDCNVAEINTATQCLDSVINTTFAFGGLSQLAIQVTADPPSHFITAVVLHSLDFKLSAARF